MDPYRIRTCWELSFILLRTPVLGMTAQCVQVEKGEHVVLGFTAWQTLFTRGSFQGSAPNHLTLV